MDTIRTGLFLGRNCDPLATGLRPWRSPGWCLHPSHIPAPLWSREACPTPLQHPPPPQLLSVPLSHFILFVAFIPIETLLFICLRSCLFTAFPNQNGQLLGRGALSCLLLLCPRGHRQAPGKCLVNVGIQLQVSSVFKSQFRCHPDPLSLLWASDASVSLWLSPLGLVFPALQ